MSMMNTNLDSRFILPLLAELYLVKAMDFLYGLGLGALAFILYQDMREKSRETDIV